MKYKNIAMNCISSLNSSVGGLDDFISMISEYQAGISTTAINSNLKDFSKNVLGSSKEIQIHAEEVKNKVLNNKHLIDQGIAEDARLLALSKKIDTVKAIQKNSNLRTGVPTAPNYNKFNSKIIDLR